MLFLSSTVFILMWFDISIFIFLKFIILGGQYISLTANDDLNTCFTPGLYATYNTNNPANCPSPSMFNNIIIVKQQGFIDRYVQFFYSINEDRLLIRDYGGESWNNWHEVSMDFPTFYKNYQDIGALAQASQRNVLINFNGDGSVALTNNAGGYCFIAINETFLLGINFVASLKHNGDNTILVSDPRVTIGENSAGLIRLYFVEYDLYMVVVGSNGISYKFNYLLLGGQAH